MGPEPGPKFWPDRGPPIIGGTSVWPEFGARNRARNWGHDLGPEVGPPCCRRWPHVRTGPGPGVQCLVGKGVWCGSPSSWLLQPVCFTSIDCHAAPRTGQVLPCVSKRRESDATHDFRSKNTVLGEVICTSVCWIVRMMCTLWPRSHVFWSPLCVSSISMAPKQQTAGSSSALAGATSKASAKAKPSARKWWQTRQGKKSLRRAVAHRQSLEDSADSIDRVRQQPLWYATGEMQRYQSSTFHAFRMQSRVHAEVYTVRLRILAPAERTELSVPVLNHTAKRWVRRFKQRWNLHRGMLYSKDAGSRQNITAQVSQKTQTQAKGGPRIGATKVPKQWTVLLGWLIKWVPPNGQELGPLFGPSFQFVTPWRRKSVGGRIPQPGPLEFGELWPESAPNTRKKRVNPVPETASQPGR